MSDLISCRGCDSPYCDGCNIKILEDALKSGLLNKFMNDQHLIIKEKFVGAVPVAPGRWILEREPNGRPYCFHCSVCDGDFHYIGIISATDFCPNCGAKMDLEDEA